MDCSSFPIEGSLANSTILRNCKMVVRELYPSQKHPKLMDYGYRIDLRDAYKCTPCMSKTRLDFSLVI